MSKRLPNFFDDDPDSWVLYALALCGCKHCENGRHKPCLIDPGAYEKSAGAIYFEATCSLCGRRQHFTWRKLENWIM
jgi:hypothetical protein